ncbi:hypothetical protein M405DRAFT_820308 [Rhizopogon salebrosus TDB-379]|nr:hypothetical protein M405DRAFT_820308 [Rhizopogon salebrosus TDB-379]
MMEVCRGGTRTIHDRRHLDGSRSGAVALLAFSIALSMTNTCIPSHFHPRRRYMGLRVHQLLGGNGSKITLWRVKGIAPELLSPSSSCLNAYLLTGSSQVDATNVLARLEGDGITEDERDNIYDDFLVFRAISPPGIVWPFLSFPAPKPFVTTAPVECRHPLSTRSTIPLQLHIKHRFFARHTGP